MEEFFQKISYSTPQHCKHITTTLFAFLKMKCTFI